MKKIAYWLVVNIVALTSLQLLAAEETPVMIKSQAGVEITEMVDWAMCNDNGIGIGGYDVVSYRQDGGPLSGSEEFEANHDGTTYRFIDADNRALFLDDPSYYLPAYSGFCAITLALGRVTCPEYTNFKIENDQLLLFEVTGFTNGRTLWNSDSDTFRHQADGNFLRLNELP